MRGRAPRRADRSLAWATPLTLALVLGPLAAGLLGTALPALGFLPAVGGRQLSLEPFRQALATPGLGSALVTTLTSGLGATLLSLFVAVAAAAVWRDQAPVRRLAVMVAPVLAVPHLALALGFAFLVAPSGWLVRLAWVPFAGSAAPPELASVQDAWGLALTAGLVLKEAPFLFLVLATALQQNDALSLHRQALSLGHGPVAAWFRVVLPAVYPALRLPIYAVLAYGLSNVEMALVLGPTTPPTLAVLTLEALSTPPLERRLVAAALCIVQLILVAAAFGLWHIGERATIRLARAWLLRGGPGGQGRLARGAVAIALASMATLLVMSLLGLVTWSLAGSWFFPAPLPPTFTLAFWWMSVPELAGPLLRSLALGLIVALAALLLVLACLEQEQQEGRPLTRWLRLGLWLPLFLPPMGFLFGVQALLVTARLDGSWLAVGWTHLLFVLPYTYLVLADPYRALDPRLRQVAASLGRSRLATFHRVVLPLLERSMALATAIGFAVGIGLYLPTVFAGGGRFTTLTTEALSLGAGGDRRLIAILALLQAAPPLLAFLAATALPRRI